MCLTDFSLRDICFQGYPYTLDNNRRRGNFIEKRLDHFVAIDTWVERFGVTMVLHLDRCTSDHRPIVCDTVSGDDVEIK